MGWDMNAYIVTYDLHKAGQNYDCLYEKLASYETHWHMQRSVWIIVTDQNAATIASNLVGCLDDNDKLFVGGLSANAAWSGHSKKESDWLKDILP